MGKPAIYYSDINPRVTVGARAWVYASEHHTLRLRNSGDWIHTSTVQAVLRDTPNGPVFETYNTIYSPVSTDDSGPLAEVLQVVADATRKGLIPA